MKRTDPIDRLLTAVLTDEDSGGFRETSLQTSLAALRNRNRRRRLVQGMARASVLVIAVTWISRTVLSPTAPIPVTTVVEPVSASPHQSERATIPGTTIQMISDEELFALFPGRPLALIGPKGNQELVFLDEVAAASWPSSDRVEPSRAFPHR